MFVGMQPNGSAAYRSDGYPIAIATQAPTLGEHNTEVLGDLLGQTSAQLQLLEQQGVIGTRPRMPNQPS